MHVIIYVASRSLGQNVRRMILMVLWLCGGLGDCTKNDINGIRLCEGSVGLYREKCTLIYESLFKSSLRLYGVLRL